MKGDTLKLAHDLRYANMERRKIALFNTFNSQFDYNKTAFHQMVNEMSPSIIDTIGVKD